MQQVFSNLLSNAIKFTPQGGTIAVEIRRGDSDVTVWITDSGVGIPPERLAFVFDRFYQVDTSLTRAHGGLGLGLAIVRHLVEQHGGTVSVDSRARSGKPIHCDVPTAKTRDPRRSRHPRKLQSRSSAWPAS
jgi:signal transduction histidine kinase